MRIAFHAAAEKETEEVADYYDLQLPGLGAEFYQELDTILDLLEPNKICHFVSDLEIVWDYFYGNHAPHQLKRRYALSNYSTIEKGVFK